MAVKYVFVTGGVVSGLGKGITAASLGRLLKARGYQVTMQKFDPYINIDPGTMNPIQHGEVFVTDDGTETDLDLGHYERFIDESLDKVMAVSLAELQLKVRPCGKIGKYLFEQLVDFNHVAAKYEMDWPQGEIWGLGDQGTIAVLMEELEKVSYDMVPAPRIAEDMTYIHGQDNREIRVYKYLDARLTLEDFFAKLALNFGDEK